MKRYLTLLSLAVSTIGFASPPSSMQDGLWEITTHTEIAGMPTQAQPVTTRTCYTKQDVESENAAAPKNDRCDIKDYRVAGNTASWTIACAGKENITGEGSITFHDRQAYSGTARLRMRPEGQEEILMRNNYRGKRISDCAQ